MRKNPSRSRTGDKRIAAIEKTIEMKYSPCLITVLTSKSAEFYSHLLISPLTVIRNEEAFGNQEEQ